MADYFETFTEDGGIIQISDTEVPMTLLKSGRVTSANLVQWDIRPKSGVRIPLPSNAISPIVFFRSPSSTNRATPILESKNVLWLVVWDNLGIPNYIDYYVFDFAPAPSTSNVGLELFDANGNRVFDDDWPILRIDDFIPIAAQQGAPVMGVNDAFVANVKPGIRVPAAGKSVYRRAILPAGVGGYFMQEALWFDQNSNQVKLNWIRTQDDDLAWGPFPTGWINAQPTEIYIADVYNLPLPYG